jgi:hypothetical protein
MYNKKCSCANKDQSDWSPWVYDIYAGPGTVHNKYRYKIHKTCGGVIEVETKYV